MVKEFSLALAYAALLACGDALGQEPDWKRLQPAPQSGVACGFFANIPALALATDVEIQTSDSFVRSVYGLRRGDFMFQRSFDKRMFYELFALPYASTEIQHPPGRAKALLPVVRKIISEVFDKGLSENRVYSLRSRGVFGGPHNTLLLAKLDGKYVVHNPYPGSIRFLTGEQLAESILLISTAKKNKGKNIYVTHYLEISLPDGYCEKPISMRKFPAELKVELSAPQREALAKAFLAPRNEKRPGGLGERIEDYPEIDFAALEEEGKRPRNVIGEELPASSLTGAINLAKFTLNTWHLQKRPLLPVLFLKGEPWVMVSYLAFDPENPDGSRLTFDNGKELLWLSWDDTLKSFRADGAMYGTVKLDWE